jgi:hypothetical protein
MPRGGPQPGAGRKSISEELGTRDLARKALIARYGSLEEALNALLATEEPALLKFVFEHAFGKPQEKVDVTSGGETIVVTFKDAE